MQLTVKQLEYIDSPGSGDPTYRYKIIEIVGTTRFLIGDVISKEVLDSHMNSGMTIIIT